MAESCGCPIDVEIPELVHPRHAVCLSACGGHNGIDPSLTNAFWSGFRCQRKSPYVEDSAASLRGYNQALPVGCPGVSPNPSPIGGHALRSSSPNRHGIKVVCPKPHDSLEDHSLTIRRKHRTPITPAFRRRRSQFSLLSCSKVKQINRELLRPQRIVRECQLGSIRRPVDRRAEIPVRQVYKLLLLASRAWNRIQTAGLFIFFLRALKHNPRTVRRPDKISNRAL